VLACAGLLAYASFPRHAIEAALGDASSARRALDDLVLYGLLRRTQTRYIILHALIHTYASSTLTVDLEMMGRLVGYYETFVRTERAKHQEGFQRIDQERRHVMRLAERWNENPTSVLRLMWAIEDYLDLMGYGQDRIRTCEIAIEAARSLEKKDDEAAFLGNLGLAYANLGQVEKAISYYQQALAIFEAIKSPNAETVRRNLARIQKE
jgi:tetratricopeptide (TPR) repeat protein